MTYTHNSSKWGCLSLTKSGFAHLSLFGVHPFLFRGRSPHLAAEKEGILLDCTVVKQQIVQNLHPEADIQLIEGVGGWAVLWMHSSFLPKSLRNWIFGYFSCGYTFGCLNHALLTQPKHDAEKGSVSGWIANELAPHTTAVPRWSRLYNNGYRSPV